MFGGFFFYDLTIPGDTGEKELLVFETLTRSKNALHPVYLNAIRNLLISERNIPVMSRMIPSQRRLIKGFSMAFTTIYSLSERETEKVN